MNPPLSSNPLVKRFAERNISEELVSMLVNKELVLTEEEYLESLVFVIGDTKFKDRCLAQLKHLPESTKANYIAKQKANHRVAYYVLLEALERGDLRTITQAIHNMALPESFIEKIAHRGTTEMLERLMENQIRLIAFPAILEIIEKNPNTTPFIRGKIAEMRDFYLSDAAAAEIPANEIRADFKTYQEQDPALVSEQEGDLLDESLAEKTMTTLQQINAMSVTERVKLALSGTKTHRMILVRDPNKMVTRAVLESPKISIDEIVMLVNNKATPGEIIHIITRNRDWTRHQAVINGLIMNPKTPIKEALGYIKKLHLRDLHLLSKDKNTNPILRRLASTYYREKVGITKR